jgi:hypothetical protein
MNTVYRVTLKIGEHAALSSMVSGGKASARRLKRAQILLAADRGFTDEVVAANVSVGTSTVYGRSGVSWRKASRPRSARRLGLVPTGSSMEKKKRC